jgi:5-methyltetrahydrofolate--homocysteine methyltransferase
MSEIKRFISVAENIHCTLIRKVGGKFAEETSDGRGLIHYFDGGDKKSMEVPEKFVQAEDWKKGKVKHMAAAMWQGFYGKGKVSEQGIDYIRHWAREQESFGATYQDVNVDEFSTDVDERKKLITWVAEIVQDASGLPLSIDSSNLDLLRAGLEACDTSRGKPMVNSVSLERSDAIELAAEYKAVVIAGATGEESMPDSMEDRVENCSRLMDRLEKAGFVPSDVHFDPLVFPVSVNKENGLIIIDTIKKLREMFGQDIHFAPGLSNISYGMPNRKLINQVFTYICVQAGLDGGIVDPRHINLKILNGMDTESEAYTITADLVLGKDDFGMNYISASREGKL